MENLPKNREIVRPEGAREDDFNDLSDAAIVELYSNSRLLKNDADKQNVEAEFERRNAEGTLDKDFKLEDDYSPRVFMDEMLSHGYSIDEEGGLHYPTPEYKAWINSDRSKPAPRGIVRETIEERIADQELEDEDTLYEPFDRANNKKVGKSAMAQTDKETAKQAREKQEKARDIQLHERRKTIEHIKDNGIIGRGDVQALANMENLKVDDAEHERATRPVAEQVEKLANYYKDNIEKVAYNSTAVGVTKAIEKGNFNEAPEEYVKNGFWAEESGRIHNRLDPENTHSKDALEAELLFQTEKAPSIIEECGSSLSSQLMKEAKKDGSEFAIYTGAYINDYTDGVVFSIPPENGAEARKFMERAGVNFAPATSSDKEFRMKVHGFANIIDAINNYPTVKKEGFKSLDWYFDNFEFGSDMPRFLDEIGQYYDEEDKGFAKTLKDYLAHRKEAEAYNKAAEKKNKKRPKMQSFEKITGKVEEDFEEFCREEEELDGTYYIFKEKSRTGNGSNSQSEGNNSFNNFKRNQGNGYVYRGKNFLSAREKYERIKEAYEDILTIDPSADFYKVLFKTEEDGVITKYRGIRFGMNGYNIAIVAPVQRRSNDAAFVVVGKPGIDNPDAWVIPFQEDPEEGVLANKLTVRSRDDVKAFNHIESKKGMNDAIDAIWMRIYRHILKATAV